MLNHIKINCVEMIVDVSGKSGVARNFSQKVPDSVSLPFSSILSSVAVFVKLRLMWLSLGARIVTYVAPRPFRTSDF